MDIEILSKNVKDKCNDAQITVSQLEKALNFSAGSISKWAQSAPSIEKVLSVARFFDMTLDELCETSNMKEELAFMAQLIKKTEAGEILWIPCTLNEVMNLRFYGIMRPNDFSEVYEAVYKDVKIYIAVKEGQAFLYISLKRNVCIEQQESSEQLRRLYSILERQKQELQQQIDLFKEEFAGT